MADVATKPKPKRKVERYEFDGDVVELRQVDPDRREAPSTSHMFGPAQRSKWEIYVNDEHLGYAFYPLGVGGPWVVTSLEPKDIYTYGLHSASKPVRCWLGPNGEHGGWDETGGCWDGLLGLLRRVKPLHNVERGWQDDSIRWTDRPTIAAGFHKLWRQGEAPDPAGVEKKIAKKRAELVARAKQDADRDARYARERVEREAQKVRDAAHAEEVREETHAGLLSLMERFGDQMSNLETAAMTRVIEQWAKKS